MPDFPTTLPPTIVQEDELQQHADAARFAAQAATLPPTLASLANPFGPDAPRPDQGKSQGTDDGTQALDQSDRHASGPLSAQGTGATAPASDDTSSSGTDDDLQSGAARRLFAQRAATLPPTLASLAASTGTAGSASDTASTGQTRQDDTAPTISGLPEHQALEDQLREQAQYGPPPLLGFPGLSTAGPSAAQLPPPAAAPVTANTFQPVGTADEQRQAQDDLQRLAAQQQAQDAARRAAFASGAAPDLAYTQGDTYQRIQQQRAQAAAAAQRQADQQAQGAGYANAEAQQAARDRQQDVATGFAPGSAEQTRHNGVASVPFSSELVRPPAPVSDNDVLRAAQAQGRLPVDSLGMQGFTNEGDPGALADVATKSALAALQGVSQVVTPLLPNALLKQVPGAPTFAEGNLPLNIGERALTGLMGAFNLLTALTVPERYVAATLLGNALEVGAARTGVNPHLAALVSAVAQLAVYVGPGGMRRIAGDGLTAEESGQLGQYAHEAWQALGQPASAEGAERIAAAYQGGQELLAQGRAGAIGARAGAAAGATAGFVLSLLNSDPRAPLGDRLADAAAAAIQNAGLGLGAGEAIGRGVRPLAGGLAGLRGAPPNAPEPGSEDVEARTVAEPDFSRAQLPGRAGPSNYNPAKAARYAPGGDLYQAQANPDYRRSPTALGIVPPGMSTPRSVSRAADLGSSDLASFARVTDESGGTRAQARPGQRLLQVLGGNLYSGDLGEVAIKEGIQNAKDAIMALPDPSKGVLKINYDTLRRTLTMQDNGVGMSEQTATTAFVDPGESFKPGENASGGYGIAKVALFANAAHIDVETTWRNPQTNQLETTRLTGSGADWLDPNKGLSVQTVQPPAPETGTKLTLTLKPDVRLDPYVARSYMTRFLRYSRLPFSVEYAHDGISLKDSYVDTTPHDVVWAGETAFPGGTADIYVSPRTSPRGVVDVGILNNGIYQFTQPVYLPSQVPLPEHVVMDLHAAANPESTNYPFRPDRQGLRDAAMAAVKEYVTTRLYTDAANRDRAAMAKTITDGHVIPGTSLQVIDSTGTMPAPLVQRIANAPQVKAFAEAAELALRVLQGKLRPHGDSYTNVRFGGIGLGDKYLAVNIKTELIHGPGSPHMILLNPFTMVKEAQRAAGARIASSGPEYMAQEVVADLVHELTHQTAWTHNEEFSSDLTRNNGVTLRQAANLADRFEVLLKGLNDDIYEYFLSSLPDLERAWGEGKTDVLGKISTQHAGGEGPPLDQSHSEGSPATGLGPDAALPGRADDRGTGVSAAAQPGSGRSLTGQNTREGLAGSQAAALRAELQALHARVEALGGTLVDQERQIAAGSTSPVQLQRSIESARTQLARREAMQPPGEAAGSSMAAPPPEPSAAWRQASEEQRAARQAYETYLENPPNPRDFPNGRGGYDQDALDAAHRQWQEGAQRLKQAWEDAAARRRATPRLGAERAGAMQAPAEAAASGPTMERVPPDARPYVQRQEDAWRYTPEEWQGANHFGTVNPYALRTHGSEPIGSASERAHLSQVALQELTLVRAGEKPAAYFTDQFLDNPKAQARAADAFRAAARAGGLLVGEAPFGDGTLTPVAAQSQDALAAVRDAARASLEHQPGAPELLGKALGYVDHEEAVRRALAAGLPVPAKVLAAYPHLRPAASTFQESPTGESPISTTPPLPQRVETAETRKSEPAAEGLTGNETTAASISDPHVSYHFRYRVVPLDSLVASHTDALAPNIAYPQELQPRLRDRGASSLQIGRIAAHLAPDALLQDVGQLDRGPMIVGPDRVVESGNGRVLALRKAATELPQQFASYEARLRELAPQYGIDPRALAIVHQPVLVRERVTPVNRPAFAAEANQQAVLTMSPLEQAHQDAARLPDAAVQSLVVGEDQPLDQALLAPRNRDTVRGFLNTVPMNERAALLTSDGAQLNQEGRARLKAALFAKTYPGEAGARLTNAFFESTDPGMKNLENGLLSSLPALARAESLTRSGARSPELSLGEDLSKAVDVLYRLKARGETVKDYRAQLSLFERELTPFQEELLGVLDAWARSSANVRHFLQDYAAAVEHAPVPGQQGLFGEGPAGPTKEELIRGIVERQQRTHAAEAALAGRHAGAGTQQPDLFSAAAAANGPSAEAPAAAPAAQAGTQLAGAGARPDVPRAAERAAEPVGAESAARSALSADAQEVWRHLTDSSRRRLEEIGANRLDVPGYEAGGRFSFGDVQMVTAFGAQRTQRALRELEAAGLLAATGYNGIGHKVYGLPPEQAPATAAGEASRPAPTAAEPVAQPVALAELRQRLERYEGKRSLTASEERAAARLRKVLTAEPDKWSPGQGVAWQVTPDQRNRGFRVVRVLPETKQAVIRQVADTGLTTSGGDHDRLGNETVYLGDLVRDKKYDAPAAQPAAEKAPAAGQETAAPFAVGDVVQHRVKGLQLRVTSLTQDRTGKPLVRGEVLEGPNAGKEIGAYPANLSKVAGEAAAPATEKTPPTAATPAAEGKQPWQMTRAEWEAAFAKTQADYTGGQQTGATAGMGRATSEKGLGKRVEANQAQQAFLKMGLPDQRIEGMPIPARHPQVVAEAVRQGLPVPAHVLAEYPALRSEPATPPSVPTERPARLTAEAVDAEPWRWTASHYLSAHGIHDPWIAEISPAQYAGLSGAAKRRYDAKRRAEFEAAGLGREAWALLVKRAAERGEITTNTPGLSAEAKDVLLGERVRQSKDQAKAALEAALRENRIASVDEVQPGDRVFDVMSRRYGTVTKTFKSSVRIRADEPITTRPGVQEQEFTVNARQLQWRSYDDAKAAAEAGTPIRPSRAAVAPAPVSAKPPIALGESLTPPASPGTGQPPGPPNKPPAPPQSPPAGEPPSGTPEEPGRAQPLATRQRGDLVSMSPRVPAATAPRGRGYAGNGAAPSDVVDVEARSLGPAPTKSPGQTLDDILGAVQAGRTVTPPSTGIEKAISSFWTQQYAHWVDSGGALETAQRYVYDQLGRPPTVDENAYLLYRLYAGRFRAAASLIQEHVGPALRPLNGEDFRLLNAVLANGDNLDKLAAVVRQYGADAAMTRKFAGDVLPHPLADFHQAVVARVGAERAARIQAAAEAIWRFNTRVRQIMRDSQVLTSEAHDYFEQAFPHYAKARLVKYLPDDSATQPIASGAKVFSVGESGIKRLSAEGATSARENPVSSLLNEWVRELSVAQRNRAALAILHLRDVSPEVAQLVQPLKDGEHVAADQATFHVLQNGVAHTYVVPKVFEQVFRIDPGMASDLSHMLGNVLLTPLFRLAATTANPLFVSAHAMRRAWSYLAQAPIVIPYRGAKVPVAGHALAAAELARAYWSSFTQHGGPDWERFVQLGGGTSAGIFGRSPEDVLREIQGGMPFTGGVVRRVNSPADWRGVLADIAKSPVTLTMRATETVDVPGHLAAYRLARKAGLPPEEAAFVGRNVPLDVERAGDWARFWNQIVPFFNIAVQHLDQLVRQARAHPAGTALSFLGVLALPALAAEAWNRAYAPDDYKDVSASLNARGLVVMTPLRYKDRAGQVRHVPAFFAMDPREALLVGIVRETARLAFGEEHRAWWDVLADLAGNLTPGELGAERGLEGLMPPTVRLAAGELSDRLHPFSVTQTQPLIPNAMRNLPPGEQVRPSTSGAARVVAAGLSGAAALAGKPAVSPERVQYALDTVVPGAARTVGAVGREPGPTGEAGNAVLNTPLLGGLAGGVLKPQYGAQGDEQQAAQTAATAARVQAALTALERDRNYQKLSPDEQTKWRERTANAVVAEAARTAPAPGAGNTPGPKTWNASRDAKEDAAMTAAVNVQRLYYEGKAPKPNAEQAALARRALNGGKSVATLQAQAQEKQATSNALKATSGNRFAAPTPAPTNRFAPPTPTAAPTSTTTSTNRFAAAHP